MAQALPTPRPVYFTPLSLTFQSYKMGEPGRQRLDTSACDCNLCLPAQQDPTGPPLQPPHRKKGGRTKARKSSDLFLSSDRPQPAFSSYKQPPLFIQRKWGHCYCTEGSLLDARQAGCTILRAGDGPRPFQAKMGPAPQWFLV